MACEHQASQYCALGSLVFLSRTQLALSTLSHRATTQPGGAPYNCHYPEEQYSALCAFQVPYKRFTVTNPVCKLWVTHNILCYFSNSEGITLTQGEVYFTVPFPPITPCLCSPYGQLLLPLPLLLFEGFVRAKFF